MNVVLPYLLRLANEEQSSAAAQFAPGKPSPAIVNMTSRAPAATQASDRAVKECDHYVLNGAKTFINHAHADLVIVVGADRSGQGADGDFSLLVVEARHEGFDRARPQARQ